MDLELAGKSVIVTGGGSNIGRALVLAFAAEGARVTVGDIDAEQAERVAEAANSNGPGSARVVPTDVTEAVQVERLVGSAIENHGGVDVLVNNVGWDQLMYFVQTTPEFWERIIRINYIGMLNCTKAVLDHMIERNRGAIVSISSDAARQGEAREAVYGGVKAAIISFMKSIARENGRFGVRCNVVCPGITIPEGDDEVGGRSMWADKDEMFTPDQLQKVAARLPLKKIGRPQDVAGAVLFLSSDATAGHITGQVLSVSGGYSMVG